MRLSEAYFSGDEDNGSMAAWFVLSAMGLYQLAPGNLTYSLVRGWCPGITYIRVRVEIMGSQKCRIAGKPQSVLVMINPMIFTRTRTTLAVSSTPALPRWHLCSCVAAA